MDYKILEQNGIENENVDGGAFNNFSANGKSGIISGVLNDCTITSVGNVLTLGTGLLLVKGIRVKIVSPLSFYLTGTPQVTQNYHLILKIQLSSDRTVVGTFFVRQVQALVQDDLYKLESGTYELEIAEFSHEQDGNIGSITLTCEKITSDVVKSVNGKTGNITLVASDVGAVSSGEFTTTISDINQRINTLQTGVGNSVAGLDEKISSNSSKIEKVSQDLTTTKANVEDVKTTANTANATANTANTTATEAKGIAEEAKEIAENASSGAVRSVNEKTGDVVLTAEDVGAVSTDTYTTSIKNIRTIANTAVEVANEAKTLAGNKLDKQPNGTTDLINSSGKIDDTYLPEVETDVVADLTPHLAPIVLSYYSVNGDKVTINLNDTEITYNNLPIPAYSIAFPNNTLILGTDKKAYELKNTDNSNNYVTCSLATESATPTVKICYKISTASLVCMEYNEYKGEQFDVEDHILLCVIRRRVPGVTGYNQNSVAITCPYQILYGTTVVTNTAGVAGSSGGSNPRTGKLGFTRYRSGFYGGIQVDENGCVTLYENNDPTTQRAPGSVYRAVTTTGFNAFLKEAMIGTSYPLELADEEKQSARSWIGADVKWVANDATILGDVTDENIIGVAIESTGALFINETRFVPFTGQTPMPINVLSTSGNPDGITAVTITSCEIYKNYQDNTFTLHDYTSKALFGEVSDVSVTITGVLIKG